MILGPLHSISPRPMFIPILPFLYLASPTLNAIAFTPYRNIQLDVFHAHSPLREFMIAHSARVRPSLG